ncbi:MAG: vWA domain-containing protein [Dehalococcoidia bacterium]
MSADRVRCTAGVEWSSERGQTLPLLGLVIVMAAVAATVVIDFGLLYASRAKAHAAADLAALAAVQDLPDTVKATDAALDWAKRNGFDDAAPDVTVTVETSGVPCAHPNACVRVTIERDFVWTFGRLFALAPAGARSGAVAEKVPQVRDIVLVLDRSGSLSPIPWSSYGPKLSQFANSSSLSPGMTADRLALVTFPRNNGSEPCRYTPAPPPPIPLDSCAKLSLTDDFGQPGPDDFDAALTWMLGASASNSNPIPAMQAAHDALEDNPRANREGIIVLLTDGDFNFNGPVAPFNAILADIVGDGWRIDVIGIGDKPLYRARLQSIASQTGGSYYPAFSATDVGAQLEAIAGISGIAVTR